MFESEFDRAYQNQFAVLWTRKIIQMSQGSTDQNIAEKSLQYKELKKDYSFTESELQNHESSSDRLTFQGNHSNI